MNWHPAQCRPGDMIRVDLGTLHHYGIFISEEQVVQFGLPPLPENRGAQDPIAVLATNIDAFACGRIVEVAHLDKQETARAFSPDQVATRALARLGETGYNLIHNNCEHFAYECMFGEKHCSQEEEARRRWNSRPLLDVYLSPVDRAQSIGTVFPPARDVEISTCPNLRLRQDKYRDWQTLCFGLQRSLNLSPEALAFEKTKYGQWRCNGGCFSLSHAGDWVAAAVSNRPVGVDLELTDAFTARWHNRPDGWAALRRKVYTSAELQAADNETAQDFLEKWTRKEAVFKRNGAGRYHPRRIDAADALTVTRRLPPPIGGILSVSGDHHRHLRLFVWRDGVAVPLAAWTAEERSAP